MRWIAMAAMAVACSAPANRDVPANTVQDTDDTDPEWSLLEHAARDPAALGPLAEHYQQRGAWDEYSAVRSEMLERAPIGPGPAPGGPFPRIGLPHGPGAARTILSRWLDPAILPELFEPTQVTQRELEARLRARGDDARLADILCSRLHFAEAAVLYERALARDPGAPRLRARARDVQRILHGR
jgi:hypothetical protein